MAQENRPYDIVVFGATGFTGVRVVEHAVRANAGRSGKPLRIGAAGRNEAKVRAAVRQQLGKAWESADVGILYADVIDMASLVAMCSRTRVLINCVGPFNQYGEPVVLACVQTGCDYVDITGEPLFMDRIFVKYDRAAKEADILVVPACGFDCVPNDLGVEYTRRQFPDPALVSSVESFFTIAHSRGRGHNLNRRQFGPRGMVGNYATFESLVDGMGSIQELSQVRKQMNRPKLTYVGPSLKRRDGLFYDPRIGRHCAPFPSADATAVRNSQYLLANEPLDRVAAAPIQFAAYCYFPSRFYAWIFAAFGVILQLLAPTAAGRSLLKRYGEWFSFGFFGRKGASEEQLRAASFSITFHSAGYSQPPTSPTQKPDVKVVTRVQGPEVGYVTTPIAIVQCALSILDERAKLPLRGVLTPAAAFRHSTLIERLHNNGVMFSVVSKTGGSATSTQRT